MDEGGEVMGVWWIFEDRAVVNVSDIVAVQVERVFDMKTWGNRRLKITLRGINEPLEFDFASEAICLQKLDELHGTIREASNAS
jgi:hypothetical protein